MRDNFNYNLIPIVEDNMNYIPVTNVPSNGYYGFQPTLPEKQPQLEMEVQIQVPQSRKRVGEYPANVSQFKRRRENEKNTNKKKKTEDLMLLEELLRETHGCNIYHWIAD